MHSDISMALNSEIHKMHNKERLKAKPKAAFPKPCMEKKEKKPFPSSEIQEAIQNLLQNSLKDQKEGQSSAVAPILPFHLQPSIEALPSHAPVAIQIAELFKEMVGCISHCMDSGINQTTMTLDSPEFSKSLFYGTKITITEYSTAPKIYNIELSASPEAVQVFQMSASELTAAFQRGNFNFEVYRIEAHISDKKSFQKGKVSPPSDKDKGRHL
ncbi:MAG TPA: hypothetical protein VLF61_00715 [Rhabdochlamydiaceae bacterium]|nr:hypothetical protein [Rhabdochlamydiaceae bacterium]